MNDIIPSQDLSEQPTGEQWLAEIEARANAATAGPWCTDSWEIYQGTEYMPGISQWIGETCRGTTSMEQDRADAAFVAAARTDVPALVTEVRELLLHTRTLEALVAEQSAEVDHLRARVTELERAAIEAERAEIRQSFMELSAQAREDRDFEGAFNVDCNLREREEQWKREDAAKGGARGRARLDATAAAQAEATHWRRLGMTPPADSQNLQTGGKR